MQALYNSVSEKQLLTTVLVLVALLSWESFKPFFLFASKNSLKRLRHGLKNLCLGAINAGLVSLLFVAAWLWATRTAAENNFGLLYFIDQPVWLETLIAVLLFDFWTYWWHRINHEVRFFWRFHRVHHSDAEMDVTTASRFHIGEIFFSSIFRVPIILLYGAELWHIALYESIMFPIVQFHHANIGLPPALDRALRVLIVTPAMHKVHHSRLQSETDSNYTSMLSVWDRAFGSLRLRADPHSIRLGLNEYDDEKFQSLIGLIETPFVKGEKTPAREQ